jgi:hypothetical protein
MTTTAQRIILASLAVIAAVGCATRAYKPSVDSQSHWLQRCEDDGQCGPFSCLCGICSSVCDADLDCGESSSVPATCAAGPSDSTQCSDIAGDEKLCVPDCSRGACESDGTAVSVVHASGMIPPAKIDPVPRCPEVAQPGDLPSLFFSADVESYEGPATVSQIVKTDPGNTVVLIPNALVDEHFDIRFNVPPPTFLSVGQRVQLLVRHGGTSSAKYDLLIVRDDVGKVLLAYHNGGDHLYSEGMFATHDTLGVSLALQMTCQSPVSDGCFKNQVQAEYQATVGADDAVVLSGPLTHVTIRVNDAPYTASFLSSSVDGGKPRPDCLPEIVPARYLLFTMIRD